MKADDEETKKSIENEKLKKEAIQTLSNKDLLFNLNDAFQTSENNNQMNSNSKEEE